MKRRLITKQSIIKSIGRRFEGDEEKTKSFLSEATRNHNYSSRMRLYYLNCLRCMVSGIPFTVIQDSRNNTRYLSEELSGLIKNKR